MKHTTRELLLWGMAMLLSVPVFTGCRDVPPGLYIKEGKFHKDGREYYGMGANYFSLFNRTSQNRGDLSGIEGLKQLAEAGMPFVRFAAIVYWPKELHEYYGQDCKAYFRNMDRIVEAAEKYGIGLIPSFFWHPATIPDYCGEHMDAFMDDDSKTSAFIREYVGEMVRRYKDSPAIWGWEFGNEFSLAVDLPNFGGGFIPPVVPSLGTPAQRDPQRDRLVQGCMTNAFRIFGETVRKYDKTRPLFSGNDMPRYCAWHNANTDTPYVADTPEQYREMLFTYEQDPINTVTVRGYYNYAYETSPNFDPMQSYPMGLRKVGDIFRVIKQWSDEEGKPMFVGEFGVQDWWLRDPEGSECWNRVDDLQEAFQERVDAIIDNNIQLSAFWVFDLPHQEEFTNATFTNSRSYMLEKVLAGNRTLQQNNSQ